MVHFWFLMGQEPWSPGWTLCACFFYPSTPPPLMASVSCSLYNIKLFCASNIATDGFTVGLPGVSHTDARRCFCMIHRGVRQSSAFDALGMRLGWLSILLCSLMWPLWVVQQVRTFIKRTLFFLSIHTTSDLLDQLEYEWSGITNLHHHTFPRVRALVAACKKPVWNTDKDFGSLLL